MLVPLLKEVERTEIPQQWRLSLLGPDLSLQAAVDGSILVGLAGVPPEKFEELAGRELHLRSGEGLRFGSSHGEVRTLELRDGHIALTFHGYVRGMTTGGAENRRSLMPTYLEWLSAQHGLSLLWGTTLYLFGLVIGLLRNWGIK